MISILTPTRNSPREFRSLITSLIRRCSNKSIVEVLIKIDDDTDDRKYVESTMRRSGFKYTILSTKRGKGYLDINKYLDELAKISKGSILWLIMDDIVVVRGDWVKCLMSTRDRISDNIYIAYSKCASTRLQLSQNKFRGSGNGVPIVSREMYTKLGCFGIDGVPFDSYIRGISNSLPSRTFFLDIWTVQQFASRSMDIKRKSVKKKLSKRDYRNIVQKIGVKSL